MRESVNVFADLKVYPTVGGKVGEVLLINRLLGDIREFDLSIFGPIKQGT